MIKTNLTLDDIRKGTLFHFIEQVNRKTDDAARFRYEGDGLRFVIDEDTVMNDWTPRQVEEALRGLEASGRVSISYRPHATHTADYHVLAFPRKSVYLRPGSEPRWSNLSRDEVTELVNTDDEFCADLVLWYFFQWLESRFDGDGTIQDYRVFQNMGEELESQDGISLAQLATCRMPDKNGVPRLVRYKEHVDRLVHQVSEQSLLFVLRELQHEANGPIELIHVDGRLWPLENGLPSDRLGFYSFEVLESLARDGLVGVERDNNRVFVRTLWLDREESGNDKDLHKSVKVVFTNKWAGTCVIGAVEVGSDV
jgi:hypothetical protein